MNSTKKKPKYRRVRLPGRNVLIYAAVCLLVVAVFAVLCFRDDSVHETEDITYGIDVARYQGTIDWEKVAQSGVDFAMIRLGYRSVTDGFIAEDTNARYNLQEAAKYGIPMGGYFFSTAVTVEEAVEEAQWVADLVAQYPITYPIAYDCELFRESYSRQYELTVTERTDIALAFLAEIERLGYRGMFYASRNDMEEDARWEASRIAEHYKIWVAQYPENPDPENGASTYSGVQHMWQYTQQGELSGIDGAVDMNVAYFGYDGIAKPKDQTPPAEVQADPEALMSFDEVNEQVTAKEAVNLRDIPSQGEDAAVLYQLQNGEIAVRTGISDSGWSRVELNGRIYYAVSSYLTTDLYYVPMDMDDGIETEFKPVNEKVTAKVAVNLRTLPSTEHKDAKVIVKIKHGEVVTRTGINEDVGWSRVVYNGQTLYCVSSYLEPAE